ncbi:hypothetical protein JTB14_028153 [Gonioctena quinquepunctata]|nr:hypothetical protein JTB14_028153 [Gonioctena quinquepunctata]
MMRTINETTSVIKHNQQVVIDRINKITSEVSSFVIDSNDFFEAEEAFDQLSSILQLVKQISSDSENAITFAEVQIEHPSVLKIEDFEWMISALLQHHMAKNILFGS